MAKRKKHVTSQPTRERIQRINPEMPDIAGAHVQLWVKEQDVPPFFRALLDGNRPLPPLVEFYPYHKPEVFNAISDIITGGFITGLPAMAGVLQLVQVGIDMFTLVGSIFFLSVFAFFLHRAWKILRAAKACQRENERYGFFLCQYAIFTRYYDPKEACQYCHVLPKHMLLDVEYHEGRRGRYSCYHHVSLSYRNEHGEKTGLSLLKAPGPSPDIEKVLRDWLARPLDLPPLVDTLDARDASLRRQAAHILNDVGWTPQGQEQRIVYLLAQQAWTELETMLTAIPRELLVSRLRDPDRTVRTEILRLLTLTGWEPETIRDRTWYFLTVRDWDSFLAIDAPMTPAPLLDALEDNAPGVHEAIAVVLTDMYASVMSVVFGDGPHSAQSQKYTLINPEEFDMRCPMPQLQHMQIATATYDELMVERFITYAINVMGRRHLKHHVEVHLYGSPDRLSPNIRNLLRRLCKSLEIADSSGVVMAKGQT